MLRKKPLEVISFLDNKSHGTLDNKSQQSYPFIFDNKSPFWFEIQETIYNEHHERLTENTRYHNEYIVFKKNQNTYKYLQIQHIAGIYLLYIWLT